MTCSPPICLAQSIRAMAATFVNEVNALSLPEENFDYRQALRQIPSLPLLQSKQALLNRHQQRLTTIKTSSLSVHDRILYDQLRYELQQQQRQVTIERVLRQNPVQLEALIQKGLARLPVGKAWYAHCIQRFTNTDLPTDKLLALGQQQVARAQHNIHRLRANMGYATDQLGFYRYLSSDQFFLADTQQIIDGYRDKERILRHNLNQLFADTAVSPLRIHSWSQANPSMPPAIYQPENHNFAFNNSTGRYNRRVMDWVFLHEGIPGHHYQLSRLKSATFQNPFLDYGYYLGNIEGWGCYVESLGQQVGLYATPEQELGRWEWDLVRSVRVVLDVGIHARGWTYQQALSYWKMHITGQDAIAHREITRVTNWPGQCMSYKVGSVAIETMKANLSQHPHFDIRRFHKALLSLSSVPLPIVSKHIEALYNITD